MLLVVIKTCRSIICEIGGLEEIKCGDYCEYHCENFIVFGEWSP